MLKTSLSKLFEPQAVAVIGASPREDTAGWVLLRNLVDGGFPGPIYPVNPHHTEIQGLATYPEVGAVGQSIDLAVIAAPIADAPWVITECGAAGVPAAVVVSTGGKETGPPGARIEAEIAAAAQAAGVRVVGPSSMGICCPANKLNASLLPYPAQPGNLALISQSGSLCSTILGWAARKNLGFSHFISTGSVADLDVPDYVDFLGNDLSAKSIIVYLENLKQPRQFLSAARSVSRVKPIIVIKAGASAAGAQAAASHTGALAGQDAAYNAAFRRAGIIRVHTFTQLFDCAEALGKTRRPLGGALGIITNAGGPGVMTVDAISGWNQEPATLTPETTAALDAVLPHFWSRGNPIDLTGQATTADYVEAVQICCKAPELDGLIVILAAQALTDPVAVARALAPALANPAKPVCAVWMGGEDVEAGQAVLNAAGVPTFETPEQAVDTFMEMYYHHRHLQLLQETPPQLPRDLNMNPVRARQLLDQCLEQNTRRLTELEAKSILSAYGIPVNPTAAAPTAAEAAALARQIGFPVVLKIQSPDIVHKSEAGGVRFYLRTEEEVRTAFEQIMAEAREFHPAATILGVTVQTQARRPEVELILGSKKDPDFGPLLLFGLGGVFTEVLQDYAVDLPPLNLLLARRLIMKTRIYKILQGYRHVPPADLDRLAEILVRLSQLVTDHPEIVELDINPLVLSGGQPLAVDARMVIEPSAVPAPRHLAISPYPNQYESYWLMRDGTPVLFRPILPEDEPLVFQFLTGCSEQTIYFRYFRHIKKFSHDLLIRFTQNDYDREIGLIALRQPPGPELMLGVSRLVMAPDRRSAEFAVIIGDPWQGQGLGPKLVSRAIEIARENGVKHLWGEVLAENQPMLDMVQKMGFSLKRDYQGGTFRIEMAL